MAVWGAFDGARYCCNQQGFRRGQPWCNTWQVNVTEDSQPSIAEPGHVKEAKMGGNSAASEEHWDVDWNCQKNNVHAKKHQFSWLNQLNLLDAVAKMEPAGRQKLVQPSESCINDSYKDVPYRPVLFPNNYIFQKKTSWLVLGRKRAVCMQFAQVISSWFRV